MRALLATISLALMTGTALAAPVEVVASFSILGDMVKQVGGDRVAVTTIVGPNADSHVYEPRPQDAAVLSGAQAFFVNGLGFEGWLERLVEATAVEGKVVTTRTTLPRMDTRMTSTTMTKQGTTKQGMRKRGMATLKPGMTTAASIRMPGRASAMA